MEKHNSINITDNKIDHFNATFVTHGDLYLQKQTVPKIKKSVLFQVEKCNESFIGRTDELKTLHNYLESKQVVIHGLGGSGKSELVRHQVVNYYESVIWIKAKNSQSLKDSIDKLAREIERGAIEKDIQNIYEYFENKSCLLIFNNALQMEDIVDFLPQNIFEKKCFHVIITSQNIEWGSLKSIRLNLLSETESIGLIKNILSPHYNTEKDDKNIKKLSQELQGLPLAIQQETTYIADIIQYKDQTYTVEKYLKSFESEEVFVNPELANPFTNYSTIKNDIPFYKRMLQTLDTIEKEKDCGLLALKILNLCALLAPDNIPKEIFLSILGHDEEKQFNKALRVIAKYSVINLIDDHFHIHRLVQRILRLEQKKNNSSEIFLLTTLNMVIQEKFINSTHNQSVLKIAQKNLGLILKFLEKCNVNQIDYLLYSLAYNGHLEALDFLLTSTENERLNINEKMLCAASQNGHIEVMKYIIQNGISINCKLENSNSPIILAALNGQLNAVKYLVENGANINDKGQDDISPLYNAIIFGHLDMVKYLCRKNANVNEPNKYLITPLHIAVDMSHFSIVKFLINAKNAKINARDCKGCTPLHYAINKNVEISKFLIEKSSNVNKKNHKNLSSFHKAIQYGDEEIVELLFENGGKLNEETANGIFPLHIAAKNGHGGIVEFLLKNGAKFPETSDTSPLHLAAINGHQNIVEIFINHPSFNDINSNSKFSLIVITIKYGHLELLKFLIKNGYSIKDRYICLYYAAKYGHLDIVKYLMNECSNVNEIDNIGNKPLHIAVENGHIEIVKLLLNANANSKMKNGGSSLHIASKYGFLTIVKYLSEQGVDLEYKTNEGFTPLYIASTYGKLDIVEFLLEKNVSIDIKTNGGRTPLHGAAMRGHLNVVECLVENGATVDALTKDNKSAVIMAADNLDIVNYLVGKGASVRL